MVTVAVAELGRVLDTARGDGMTLAIIDTALHAAPDAARAAQVADLILVPVRPTAFDLAAAQGQLRLSRRQGQAHTPSSSSSTAAILASSVSRARWASFVSFRGEVSIVHTAPRRWPVLALTIGAPA